MQRQPLTVEVVGVAGAGKTTLLRALSQHNKKIQAVFQLRSTRYIPLYAKCALALLPVILRQCLEGKGFTWQEINWMIRLKALHYILKRWAVGDGSVIISDQGPVYTLTRLLEPSSKRSMSHCFDSWWESTLKEWVAGLDVIIWLDAPDKILIERIHTRDKWHLVKDNSEQEAYRFLANSRTLYEQAIAKLTTKGRPNVLCFDTNRESLDQIVDNVLIALDVETKVEPSS